jgi:hypothetical protein
VKRGLSGFGGGMFILVVTERLIPRKTEVSVVGGGGETAEGCGSNGLFMRVAGIGILRFCDFCLACVVIWGSLGCGFCVVPCFRLTGRGCGGVPFPGSFRLGDDRASAVVGRVGGSGGTTDLSEATGWLGFPGFSSAFAGRILPLHHRSCIDALYLGFLVWQMIQKPSWGLLDS